MTEQLAPPVLSTPDTHVLEDPTPDLITPRSQRPSNAQLNDVYEIERTVREIRAGGWSRIALQFPDGMLQDAPRVFEALELGLKVSSSVVNSSMSVEDGLQELDIAQQETSARSPTKRLFILADTSYGACCVDEIAAEHVDADVVVHYGRSCLSPTARLPVIYVYTSHELQLDSVVKAFEKTYSEKDCKVILMADVTFSNHLLDIHKELQSLGYSNIFVPSIIHDPSSPLPNRTVPNHVKSGTEELKQYSLFHISDPPPALLLTLSSRLASMYIYPTDCTSTSALEAQTTRILMRRYGVLTSLSTNPIFGILINTLSVKNYLHTITALQNQIAAAGKKSYTFVVGKINAAKVANFSEIGGWVVVGCWESSLIESKDFFRPIITPFELGLALQSDEERVWTGEWKSDFNGITDDTSGPVTRERTDREAQDEDGEFDDEQDSAPPEYDLRTGRYVSHSRPMRNTAAVSKSAGSTSKAGEETHSSSQALLKRATGDLAMINGTASPGAEFLRSQRTWQGLGSDFEIRYEDERGAAIEEGRSGVARGYTVGEATEKK